MRNPKVFIFYVLLALMLATTNAVAAAEWMPGLRAAGWVAAFGLLAGAALAYSSFPAWTAHLTSWMYGTFVIGVVAGTSGIVPQALGWRERVLNMAQRVNDVLYTAIHGGASTETLHFFLLVCAITWLFSFTAAWYTFRYPRVWNVVLPSGLVLFSNVYFYGGHNPMEPYLAVYLLAVVVLLVHSFITQREEEWSRANVRFAPNLRKTFTLASVAFGVVAILLAWQLPVWAEQQSTQQLMQSVQQPYSDLQVRAGRLFSGIQNYNIKPVQQFRDGLPLEGARNLSEEAVMSVVAPIDVRHYWRARSLDRYDGRGWTSTLAEVADTPARQTAISATAMLSRTAVNAEFTLAYGTDTLFTSGQPVNASIPVQAVINGSRATATEILQLRAPQSLNTGQVFSTIGSVSTAEIEKLRRATGQYPRWVTDRYLQLPSNIPARVRALATDITKNDRTAFDKAAGIERWLRTNIAYDETIPAPPPDREGTDYLLFDIKRGYCTYYATAMVVMLRAQGVPARIAEGFAQGIVDINASNLDNATYVVRQRDRHAWVEVFFSGYGWVTFEPTAGQAALERATEPAPATPTPVPATTTPVPAGTPTPDPAAAATPEAGSTAATVAADIINTLAGWLSSTWAALLTALPWLVALGAVIALVTLPLRWAETRGLQSLRPVARAYAVISRWASWFGIGATNTPHEQADALARRAPGAAPQARAITDLYVSEQFGPPQPAPVQVDEAGVQTALRRSLREFRRRWVFERLGWGRPSASANAPDAE